MAEKTEYEAAREKLEAERKQYEEEQAKNPEQKRAEALLKFGASMMGKPKRKIKRLKAAKYHPPHPVQTE